MCEGIWFAWNILICSIASIKILCFLLSLAITLKVLQPPSPMVLWFRQKWPLWAPGEQAPDAGTSQAQNESFPTDEGQEVSSDGWTERDQGDISLTSWSSSISHIKLLLKVLLVLEQRFYAASSSWLLCDILKRGTQTSDPFLRAKGCFSRKSCLLPVRSIHRPPGLDSAIGSFFLVLFPTISLVSDSYFLPNISLVQGPRSTQIFINVVGQQWGRSQTLQIFSTLIWKCMRAFFKI